MPYQSIPDSDEAENDRSNDNDFIIHNDSQNADV